MSNNYFALYYLLQSVLRKNQTWTPDALSATFNPHDYHRRPIGIRWSRIMWERISAG